MLYECPIEGSDDYVFTTFETNGHTWNDYINDLMNKVEISRITPKSFLVTGDFRDWDRDVGTPHANAFYTAIIATQAYKIWRVEEINILKNSSQKNVFLRFCRNAPPIVSDTDRMWTMDNIIIDGEEEDGNMIYDNQCYTYQFSIQTASRNINVDFTNTDFVSREGCRNLYLFY